MRRFLKAFVACCLALQGLILIAVRPTAAADCNAERSAGIRRIGSAAAELRRDLAPYDAAVREGDLVMFNASFEAVEDDWWDLVSAQAWVHDRLRRLGCAPDGVATTTAMPSGYETVLTIGPEHLTQLDRNLAETNARAMHGGVILRARRLAPLPVHESR
jgi:hypothetical protein